MVFKKNIFYFIQLDLIYFGLGVYSSNQLSSF